MRFEGGTCTGRGAFLAIADGTVFQGEAFGAEGEAIGEVVFNTSMTGYQEILTDPSYRGQLVAMTYPEIGNVGVNREDVESRAPFVSGFIVREYWPSPSSWRAEESLGAYLRRHGIVGISGIDTRALVRRLREVGSQEGSRRRFIDRSLMLRLRCAVANIRLVWRLRPCWPMRCWVSSDTKRRKTSIGVRSTYGADTMGHTLWTSRHR